MLPLDHLETADAAADVDADAFGDLRRDLQLRSPASRKSAAAMANWMKRPIFLISFFSM